MRVTMALAIVLALALPAAAQVTVNGPPAAWQDVMAAYQRLASVRTYRMKIKGTGVPAGGIVVEVVNPDRRRTLVPLGKGGFETIVVGNESRTRVGNGPWQCQAAPGSLGGGTGGWPPDLRRAKGEVTVTRLGPATIEGVRTQGYEVIYSSAPNAQPTTIRLYVLQSGGILRRAEVLDKDEKVAVTIDYYDVNAPITIELPKCA